MQRHLEIDGTRIPRLGFGTWEVVDACYESVRHALDVGYRHLDTAQAYGNEEHVGRAVADSDVDRDEVFLTTKVWRDAARAQDVHRTTEESLRKLRVDHVDLLLLHWPADVPLEETLGAMAELRDQGRTRLIGVSNFPSDLLDRAVGITDIATNQVEYHPFLDQAPVLQAVRKHGLSLTAYSPLAHGDVIGDDTLTAIGQEHGKSAAQVALRWLLEQDRVIAIPRSESEDHIAANFDVFDFELSDEQRERIDDLPKDHRTTDPPWAPDWD